MREVGIVDDVRALRDDIGQRVAALLSTPEIVGH